MENQLTATGILSLLETSKEQRASFVQSVITQIRDGNADPLQIHIQVKNTEDLVKQIIDSKEYRALLLDEADKYGKSFERFNAKFEKKEVGTKYDFGQCGDSILVDLQAKADVANAALKERQEFLKKLPEGGIDILDPDSGEVSKVYRPTKTSTTSIAVTLK